MRIFIILFFLIIISKSFGQTYSNLISDKEIEELILLDIKVSEKYEEEPKLGRKNINQNILNPQVFIDNISDEFLFTYDQKYREIFSNENTSFYEEQTKNFINTKWNLKSSKAKFKNNFKNDFYYYSIPLLNIEKDYALIYKSFWCGDECGHGSISLYKKENKKWIYVDTLSAWIN